MTHADSLINTPEPDTDVALVVDLDGTLVRSDLLIESAFVLAHQRPQSLLKAPGWLKTGKGRLKSEIARRVELGVADLPYNEALIDFLRAERQRGRTVILATAANEKYARQVADHLRVFDHVLASTDRVNLSGQKKLDAIRQHLNGAEFDYAGDSDVDRVLWRHSRQAILVNANARLERQVRDEAQVGPTFAHEPGGWRVWARALRVHQWMKNALIFLPLIAAHNYTDLAMLGVAVLAFIAFSVLASSVYLLNDLIDLGDDRRHPTKRERPFACGRLPLIQGVIAVPALLITAAIIALFLPPAFGMVMLGYYALTLAYSLALKRLALIDVLTLAGLYTVRIVAGGVATGVPLSFWLLALSMSIFLSLAMAKRCTELMLMARTDETPRGRGYVASDLDPLRSLGTAAGYASVVILALYINSPDITDHYSHPARIWLLCPVVLYWISRIWLTTLRGQMDDDPIVFAARDTGSRICVVAAALIMVSAL